MKLYDKLDIIAKEKIGAPYDEIIKNPRNYLSCLLEKHSIGSLIDIACCVNTLDFDRVIHIINLYLFGEAFFKDLISLYSVKPDSSPVCEWEILALVHDVSYIYETAVFSRQYLDLNDVCDELNLKPFFTKSDCNAFYSKKTYEDYFKYKREHYGVCDHGILAGILFENKFPESSGLKKLELAYVIASHNIFVANRNNADLYHTYNLSELIPDSKNFNSIAQSNTKYSYFYLLFCLLDILEPVNAFNCASTEDIKRLLSSIEFSVNENRLAITTSLTTETETIAHRIFDIPIWLKVGLNIESDKKIIINLKNN